MLCAVSKLLQKLPEGWPELNSVYRSYLLCFQLLSGINKLSLLNSPNLKSLNICRGIMCTWKQKPKHLETRSCLRTSFYKYFSRKRSLCFHRAIQALWTLWSAHIKYLVRKIQAFIHFKINSLAGFPSSNFQLDRPVEKVSLYDKIPRCNPETTNQHIRIIIHVILKVVKF